MDEEVSRSSMTDEEDYVDDNDNGEDYEATIEEEEALDGDEDYADELKDLEDDNELTLEEIQRKYGYPPAGEAAPEEAEEDYAEEDVGETSNPVEKELFDSTILDVGNSLSGLDDDDDDYAPPDPWKRQIRVDPQQFQATVPEFDGHHSDSSRDEEDTVLWTNDDANHISDEDLNKYLKDVVELRRAHEQPVPPQGCETHNDEDALCALYRNHFDVEKAKQSFPFPHINAPFRTVRPDALGFDEEEVRIFQESLEQYGKDFPLIRRLRLPYRKVGELIEYYYQWKLTPSYRTWRDAHPQHAPVVQPHLSATFYHQVAQMDPEPHGATSFAEASISEPSTSEEPSSTTD